MIASVPLFFFPKFLILHQFETVPHILNEALDLYHAELKSHCLSVVTLELGVYYFLNFPNLSDRFKTGPLKSLLLPLFK